MYTCWHRYIAFFCASRISLQSHALQNGQECACILNCYYHGPTHIHISMHTVPDSPPGWSRLWMEHESIYQWRRRRGGEGQMNQPPPSSCDLSQPAAESSHGWSYCGPWAVEVSWHEEDERSPLPPGAVWLWFHDSDSQLWPSPPVSNDPGGWGLGTRGRTL
jgi:hypothetical protein